MYSYGAVENHNPELCDYSMRLTKPKRCQGRDLAGTFNIRGPCCNVAHSARYRVIRLMICVVFMDGVKSYHGDIIDVYEKA